MTKMKFGILGLLLVIFSVTACKEEVKSGETPEVKKKVLSSIEKKQVTSIMIQAMGVDELKTFGSAAITTGVFDLLSEEDGPFTVFAPTNSAFDSIPSERMRTLLNPKEMEAFKAIILSHIIDEPFDLDTLSTLIQKEGGTFTMTSVSGAKISASLDGETIVLKDANGGQARVLSGDVKGGNGLLHQVDAVMIAN